eukprot:m.264427 g.264427  ORF g.264427 m.264427 type:complete len:219 (+) comp40469_c0_seq85:1867-2523(+)
MCEVYNGKMQLLFKCGYYLQLYVSLWQFIQHDQTDVVEKNSQQNALLIAVDQNYYQIHFPSLLGELLLLSFSFPQPLASVPSGPSSQQAAKQKEPAASTTPSAISVKVSTDSAFWELSASALSRQFNDMAMRDGFNRPTSSSGISVDSSCDDLGSSFGSLFHRSAMDTARSVDTLSVSATGTLKKPMSVEFVKHTAEQVKKSTDLMTSRLTSRILGTQ